MWHFLYLKIIQEIIWVFSGLLSDMYYLKQTQEGAPRKELLQKRDKEKGEEW